MSDAKQGQEWSEHVWQRFESYEQAMCERGSGMTREQITGAAIFWAWLQEQMAANGRALSDPAHLARVKRMEEAGQGVQLIAAERQRQVDKEGWFPAHDDTHDNGEMAITAACYAVHHTDARVFVEGEDAFPWGSCADKRKKHSAVRALVIAGALIAAEIDRLQRAALADSPGKGDGK